MKNFWHYLKRAFIWLFFLHLAYTLVIWVVNPPITLTMLGSLLAGDGLKRDYVPLREMSKNARLAVMASEDQLFPDHFGFDIKGIQAAMEYNENQTGKLRGGVPLANRWQKTFSFGRAEAILGKGLKPIARFG